jgi:O-succinylbenzoic acid--CoA ligase
MNDCLTINGVIYNAEALKMLVSQKLSNAVETWEWQLFSFISDWISDDLCISLRTSGSTGVPQTITFPKSALKASAQATLTFFDIKPGSNALLCLPAEYVAARLMVVRAFVGQLNLLVVPPAGSPLENDFDEVDFAAMVPLQVINELERDGERINQIKKLLIGGSAASSELIASLQKIDTKVWETYGMTETLTHVAVRRLNGKSGPASCFEALPGVSFAIDHRGCLMIDVPAICDNVVVTNDLVRLIDAYHFKFLGRVDNVINSGGVKIVPEQVEDKLGRFFNVPFAISEKPHSNFGSQIVLVFEGDYLTVDESIWAKAGLSRYEIPKQIISIPEFPRTANGKVIRSELKQLLRKI